MLENDNKTIIRDCVTLESTIDEAMDWVGRYLSLPGGQLAAQNSLKNYRRLARRYHRAAQRKPCAAVFGASQVGKSYLVSNMAKLPGADTLEIIVPGENKRIDFIKHINPSGGRESTGLVTRFTIDNNHHPGDAPFFLGLLSQTDIVKILTNGYLSDIKDRQDDINREQIQELFKNLQPKDSPKPVDGMDEDDIYDLKEYLTQNFNDQILIRDLTRIHFWEDIADLAPRLKSEDRWQVFHLLWGKLPLLTELFNKLSCGLKALGFAPEARCGLDALVPKEINREGTVTPNTIIDVQVINRLLEQDKDTLGAVTVTGSTGCTASLSKSLLTGLIAEITMILPPELGNQPSRSFFNHIDLLDFPGARSRKKIPLANLAGDSIHENIEVFLRGKIAFLFDRYSYENEITSLLLCIADGPQEVQSIPQLIGDWVYKTHGDIPEKRNNKMVSLLTVFTKF
ncbi:MAG: hypothetical protein QG657_2104, partial [Acidobacteriota bacterium]|nr:hypothetical protein [Acidobacteriota bacterium]